MKSLVLLLSVFCCNVLFGQMKSDLSFLQPTTLATVKEATHWGYKEYSQPYIGISFRILQTRDFQGESTLYIEFKNENNYAVSFLYCVGQENDYKNKANWKTYNRIYLESNEVKHQRRDISSYKSSYYITIGAVLLNRSDKYYQVFGIDNSIKCGYCYAIKDDPKCQNLSEDNSDDDYEVLPFEGEDFTDIELGKAKGTIPLSKEEKNNAKIDAGVQVINSLFKIGREIKKNKKEKQERLLNEKLELSRQNQESAQTVHYYETNKISKAVEKVSVSEVKFIDELNGNVFTSGQVIFKDNSKYIGEWNNYLKSDGVSKKGKFYFANGDQYEGGFYRQQQNGWGTYTWANGQKFTGTFYNGDIQGNGTMTYKNNTYDTGYFKRTTDNMGMNFDNEVTKAHMTYRSSDGSQLWEIKNPTYIIEY